MTTQLAPVQRKLLSESVHDALLADILSGRMDPGDALPAERQLSEAFGVNRHAVREAIKRLQQAGLVQVAQGGTTKVNDWKRTAGLDLLTSLAGEGDPEILRAILEMRACVGADVARLCAERAPATAGIDPSRDEDGYVAFWEAIADGADNLAYRLALNTLVAAQRHGGIDPAIYAGERDDLAAQRELAEAIAAGDGAGAQARADALLRRSLTVTAPQRRAAA